MSEKEVSSNSENQAANNPAHLLDLKRFKVEKITLVVLTTYAAIAGYQACQMKRATDETKIAAQAARDSADLQRKVTEGSQAAWLIPSQQDLNRNFLTFGVQNMGGISAENVAVTVQMKLVRTSDSQTLWTESFPFDTVKYLPPKQNTNGQRERTLSKYTRKDFEGISKNMETLILSWTATYDNGFKRTVQQDGCARYLALFKPPQVAAMPQWVGCEGAPQLLRQLHPPSEQWSLQ